MPVFKPALVYFALVFAAGFILGIVRVLLFEPAMGARTAELIEAPFMLTAVYFAARSTVSRWGRNKAVSLAYGLLALALLLLAEISVVLGLRDQTLEENLADRDPVSGIVYAVSLVIFGLMPGLLFRGNRSVSDRSPE